MLSALYGLDVLALIALQLASSVVANPHPALITAAPILPRQDLDARFVGFYSASGLNDYTKWWCPSGYTWCESGTYGGCMSTTASSCNPFTSCYSLSSMAAKNSVNACTGTNVCFTNTVYPFLNASTSSTWLACGVTAWSFYKQVNTTSVSGQSTRTTSNTAQSTRSVQTAPTNSDNALPGAQASSTTSRPTATPTNSNDNQSGGSSSSSKAWIAGPVLGGLAFIGVGIGLFIILRRRRKDAGAGPGPNGSTAVSQDPNMPGGPGGVAGAAGAYGASSEKYNQTAYNPHGQPLLGQQQPNSQWGSPYPQPTGAYPHGTPSPQPSNAYPSLYPNSGYPSGVPQQYQYYGPVEADGHAVPQGQNAIEMSAEQQRK